MGADMSEELMHEHGARIAQRVDEGRGAVARRGAAARPPRTMERVQHAAPGLRYHGWQRHLKRGLDVTIALVMLPLLLPLMFILAAAISLSSPGTPFFLQERVGYRGQRFKCIKFRTMRRDAEERLHGDPEMYAYYVAHDFKLPIRRDPRVFPLGRLLRHSSLDEIPQILNVLNGDMSLVGPRPVVPAELSCYGPWKGAYLSLRPGMTGRWQTNGRNSIRYPERAEIDAEYLATWRFTSDLRILARTLPSLFRHRHI